MAVWWSPGRPRQRHQDGRHPGHRQLGHRHGPRPADHQVGGGVGGGHPVLVGHPHHHAPLPGGGRRLDRLPVAAADDVVDRPVVTARPPGRQPLHGGVDPAGPQRPAEHHHGGPVLREAELGPGRPAVLVPPADGGDGRSDRRAGDHRPGERGVVPPHRAGPGEAAQEPVGRPGHRVHVHQHQGDPEEHGGRRGGQAGVAADRHHHPGAPAGHQAERLDAGGRQAEHGPQVPEQHGRAEGAGDPAPGQQGHREPTALQRHPVLPPPGAHELDGGAVVAPVHQRLGDGDGRLQVPGGAAPGQERVPAAGHAAGCRAGRRPGTRSWEAMFSRIPMAAMVISRDDPP